MLAQFLESIFLAVQPQSRAIKNTRASCYFATLFQETQRVLHRNHDAEEGVAFSVLAGAALEESKMVRGDRGISQRSEAPLDGFPGYLTIQTSFESSLSFASLARASASEENLTRTLNVVPDLST